MATMTQDVQHGEGTTVRDDEVSEWVSGCWWSGGATHL